MDSTVFPKTSGVYGIEATVAFWRKRSFSGEKRDFSAEKTRFFFGKKGGKLPPKTRFSSMGALNGPSIGTLAVFEAKQPFPGHA